jgi:hypothetical protein
MSDSISSGTLAVAEAFIHGAGAMRLDALCMPCGSVYTLGGWSGPFIKRQARCFGNMFVQFGTPRL